MNPPAPPPPIVHSDALNAALLLLVILALCYRLALAQAAVAGVSRARLRALADEGNRRAALLDGLLSRRDAVQVALRLALGVGLVAAATTSWWLARDLAARQVVPVWVTGLVTLAVVMLGAEGLPRLLVATMPEEVALSRARWIDLTYRLLGPFVRLWLGEPAPSAREEADEEAAEESIRELVDAVALRPTRKRRITEILEFPDKTAGEVMVPRIDMVGVEADAPLTEAAAAIEASGYSRLPVYGDSKDDIVGIVHARDLLGRLPGGGVARDAARDALFVPETMRLDQLLRVLRAAKLSTAIVVDEYGGTAGMVTVEDVVEEIVGEIEDETDTTWPTVQPRPEGGWTVPARTELADLAEHLGLEVELEPSDECLTVGGLVLALAGEIPEVGQVVIHEAEGQRLSLLTVAMEGPRIGELAVLARPVDDEAAGAEDAEVEVENSPDGGWEVSGGALLGAVERRLGYDLLWDTSATVAELFAFWPCGARTERGVRWRRHRARVVDEGADGELRVRFEEAE